MSWRFLPASFVMVLLSAGVLTEARMAIAQSSTTPAQSSTTAAESLFDEARTAMAEKRFEVACYKFRESDRLDPALGTRFNLANCEEQRGRLATASQLYRQVLEQLPPGDARAVVASDRIRSLDARVPHLSLRARGEVPAGTAVTVAGLVLQAASFGTPVPLDPGAYVLSVSSPGRVVREFPMTLAEGEQVDFVIAVDPPEPVRAPLEPGRMVLPTSTRTPMPKASAVPAPDPEPTRPVNRDPTPAYVAGAVGAAGLGVGVVAGLAGLHEKSVGDGNCSDRTRTCNKAGYDANQSARSLATASTVGFVAGVLGAGLSAYLWFTLPDENSSGLGVGGSEGAGFVQWRVRF